MTVYDKAHKRFHLLNENEKHEFYLKLVNYYGLEDLKQG